jgi:hypothetical protein
MGKVDPSGKQSGQVQPVDKELPVTELDPAELEQQSAESEGADAAAVVDQAGEGDAEGEVVAGVAEGEIPDVETESEIDMPSVEKQRVAGQISDFKVQGDPIPSWSLDARGAHRKQTIRGVFCPLWIGFNHDRTRRARRSVDPTGRTRPDQASRIYFAAIRVSGTGGLIPRLKPVYFAGYTGTNLGIQSNWFRSRSESVARTGNGNQTTRSRSLVFLPEMRRTFP